MSQLRKRIFKKTHRFRKRSDFQGSGFYLTDYKTKSGESSSSKTVISDSKKPAAASTDTAKTETKTASSKDTKPSEKKDSNPKTENK